MRARTIHRFTAFILITFVISHLSVHLTALFGPSAHQAALGFVQQPYRHPVGETILVAAIITQIITGFRRLRFWNIWGWDLAQVISGGYLLIFLSAHTTAAVYTHNIFGLETDFYWAAGSMAFEPIKYGFAVYYLLAILAVFTHLGAAIHFALPKAPNWAPYAMPVLGVGVASCIIAALSGALYPIEIPDNVFAYYHANFGVER